MAHQTASAPNYMATFACIGAACEDSCCSGWNVTVDKAAYKKLKTSSSVDISKAVKTYFKISSKPSNHTFASIELDGKGQCPMLDSQSMCSIQTTLGNSYLPRTCADFPRYYFKLAKETTVLGTLACPELARKCLLDINAFEQTTIEIPFTPNQLPPYRGGFNFEAKLHPHPLQRNLELIREVVVQILKRRDYFLWQRLMAVGLLSRHLEVMHSTQDKSGSTASVQNDALIAIELQKVWSLLDSGKLKELLGDMTHRDNDLLVQQALLKELTAERLKFNGAQFGGVKFVKFLKCIANAFQGIEYAESDPIGTATRFKHAEEKWFGPFVAKNPHIAENFIINLVLTEMFPAIGDKGPERQWQEIMLRYAMVRFYLVGLAGKHKESFGNDHFVEVIYSFSREVLHSNTFLDHMFNRLQKAELMNLATMSILVKD
jgi:lysine-N-methylase